ncbi:MAG: RecQ family ATP-dependent DNA helicase [Candidatus Zixiibacteriota bacterium]|nr:MAG: RecQ family ATP-dependent DNA helicase [candidate division Zixibacteria bacterium]
MDQARDCLRRAVGQPEADFRSGQWECISALLQKQRLLVVERTGWGKSMVYFVATRLLRRQGSGPALLISPLLALMRNQMEAAQRLGLRAETINSSNREDWDRVKDRLLHDTVDLLLVSPERLGNDDFRMNLLQRLASRLGLFVVDEAHCISDWGHDFRPDYRRIVRVLQALPANIPVLATTATANDRVVRDIASQLGRLQVRRGPLRRDSLALQNIILPDPAARLAWLVETLPRLPGSGIIYALTIRDAERVALWLKRHDLLAEAYHSEVSDEGSGRREALEARLLNNELKALVATVALGMGFDKPDLGFVIHYQRPGSVVHYYQQVGRAGRAVDHAYGLLLAGEEDADITEYFIQNALPPAAHISAVLDRLNGAAAGLSVREIEAAVNLRHGQIEKVLRLLSVENPSPVTRQGSKWFATPVIYRVDETRVERLIEIRRAEQCQMQDYIHTRECLMRFLARALDDTQAGDCGKCANCRGEPLLPVVTPRDRVQAATAFLRRSHQRITPRRWWPFGEAFPQYGFTGRIAPELAAEEGRVLSTWGEAGWGELVKVGKYTAEQFSLELVEGCAELLDLWNPDPPPEWVTCVPSLQHAILVPDFARGLAGRRGLPFVPGVIKVKANRPQKEMENSYQQARNLDGVFAVEETAVRPGPVLLVDDMIDSGWTLTVVAALLRQAGCSRVYPLALATTLPRLP